MTCFHPVQSYRMPDGSIAFGGGRSSKVMKGHPFELPCGKCQGCRLEHSRIWAIRCVKEASMHAQNSFVTLTYRDDKLPENGSLILRDLQLFFKRLRKALWLVDKNRKVRYYACGEYGDKYQRPHYHAILFGVDFGDKLVYSPPDENGEGGLYTSRVLDGLWTHGQCIIGVVNFKTCSYVARYCMKKVDGNKRKAGHYLVYTSDGVVSERLPEFAVMSRRPGIGAPWYDKYGNEVREHDSIILDGQAVPSIRYFDLRGSAIDPVGLEGVKFARSPESIASADERKRRYLESSPPRLAVKEELLRQRLKQKDRKL